MSALLADFHWLRPGWLFLLPALPLLLWARRGAGGSDGWREHCDAGLMDYLGESSPYRTRRWPVALLLLGWLLAVSALAGPAWERTQTPVYRSDMSRVVVLDLSRSMNATDVVPDRLTRARYKVADLLARAAGGRVGLVVFAGAAFALAPLTDDVNTLLNLVPALETALMPVQGSRADLGIEQAVELMQRGGATRGDILLVTDGAPAQAEHSARAARAAGFRVAVLMVGTRAGAPIPGPGGGFLKDDRGRIVVPGVDAAQLLAVASAGGGRAATMSIDDGDIDRLLDDALEPALSDANGTEQRQAGQRWRDRGPWLLLLVLPLAACAFRRGWLLSVGLLALMLPPSPASALQWSELWQRPEQRVRQALDAQDAETALRAATDAAPAWRGSALYRAGDYAAAAEAFAADDDAAAHYNRGNALAQAGQLEGALAAYQRALSLQPGFEDAEFNRTLVERLLQEQRERQQERQQQDDQPQDDQQQGEQGDRGDDGQPQPGATDDGEQSVGAPADDSSKDEAGETGQAGTQADGRNDSSDADNAAAARGDDVIDADGDGEPDETGATADAVDGTEQQPGQRPDTAIADSQPVDDATAARIEQMLRRVPDDPGGLLRRKFALEQARRSHQRAVVEQAW